jgi:hypothetical protein
MVQLLLPVTTLAANCSCSCFCGVSQASKIVGGVNANVNEFPWQVETFSSCCCNLHFPQVGVTCCLQEKQR